MGGEEPTQPPGRCYNTVSPDFGLQRRTSPGRGLKVMVREERLTE